MSDNQGVSTLVYPVLFSKASTRKNKKWECDGYLAAIPIGLKGLRFELQEEIVNGRTKIIFNELASASELGMTNIRRDVPDFFSEGYELLALNGYDIQIQGGPVVLAPPVSPLPPPTIEEVKPEQGTGAHMPEIKYRPRTGKRT